MDETKQVTSRVRPVQTGRIDQTPRLSNCQGDLFRLRLASFTGLFITLCLSLFFGGCFTDEMSYPGRSNDGTDYPDNLPPKTFLSIQADSLRIDIYQTIISWWGTDSDGHVAGYAYKWDGPWQPEPEDLLWDQDSSWVYTEATTDTFNVPVVGTYAERTFFIRAIDNHQTADPEPLSQTFRVTNFKPLVAWTDTTRHPTDEFPSLPAISFAWTPEDYDGRDTIKFARLWLDTIDGEDPALSTITVENDTIGAFSPEHFQGRIGPRTVSMQIFDYSLTPSDTISWSWTVVDPVGEYLLVDNASPSMSSTADKQDRFWRGQMDLLFPGNYHIYDVEYQSVFRSAPEVLPMFKLFKGVVWYGIKFFDNQGGSSEDVDEEMRLGLSLAESALIPYAESGGKVFITAHNLFGTGGGLSESFWKDQFGIKELYLHPNPDPFDNTPLSDATLPRNVYVQCSDHFGVVDSLKIRLSLLNVDYFDITSALTPLLWVDMLTLAEGVEISELPDGHDDEVYLGAQREEDSGGSVNLVTTMLTEFSSSSTPELAVESFLRNLFGIEDGE